MNRRTFFRNLVLGAVAVPAAALAKSPPKPTASHVADIPPEAGKVNCMALFSDHVFVGCDNGLWTIKLKD